MHEKAVEEIVKRFPREVFPDLELTIVESQRRRANTARNLAPTLE